MYPQTLNSPPILWVNCAMAASRDGDREIRAALSESRGGEMRRVPHWLPAARGRPQGTEPETVREARPAPGDGSDGPRARDKIWPI